MQNLPRILRIVLTGGPSGGKSTFLEHFQTCLHPFTLIVVEESASAIKAQAALPKPRSGSIDFQREVIHKQMLMEDMAIKQAKRTAGHVIVLCDRGVFDSVGFVPYHLYEEAIRDLNLTPRMVLLRYDAIVFLRSIDIVKHIEDSRCIESRPLTISLHVCNVERALSEHVALPPCVRTVDAQHAIAEKFRLTQNALLDIAASFWCASKDRGSKPRASLE